MAKDFTASIGQGLLQQVASKTSSMANTANIVRIPLEEVHENPDNNKIFSMDKIDRLADTIEDEGFVGAIEVFKISDHYYEISSGHRRFEAMKMVGEKTIPCIILPNMSETDKAKRLLNSNINNRELTPLIYGRMIRYYRDHIFNAGGVVTGSGNWRKDAAQFFGMSQSQVFRYFKLNSLIPELQKIIEEDPEFPWTRLDKVSAMPEDEQQEIYLEIKKYMDSTDDELNAAKIRQLIEWVDNSRKRKAQKDLLDKELKEQTENFNTENGNFEKNIIASVPESSSVPQEVYEKKQQQLDELIQKRTSNNYQVALVEDTLKNITEENTKNPILNDPEAYIPTTHSTTQSIPSEVYMESSIEQLRLSLSGDMHNKETISQKISEIELLLNQIKLKL